MTERIPDKNEPAIKPRPAVGAYLCESTARNADYWLTEAKHADVEYSSAVMFFEQAINAWKNLAYSLARSAHYYNMQQSSASSAIGPYPGYRNQVIEECAKLIEERIPARAGSQLGPSWRDEYTEAQRCADTLRTMIRRSDGKADK